ncbi:MAG: 2-oxoglutarate ferredoxin oxidoreductase subunit gamma [Actinomycetota bacterium]|jgi:Pyruvate/2-oxoacid:ferredoxin oxidoreductase gamma subunit|nr:2-oxoglutarate ferredoxin oxidoreductase subunit gamma [Actinomycetota bacterium]
MERELLITGIGGQGVQLAAQVVARAATLEGREVLFFGLYGGMMRGGNTDSTVVVADEPIEAPPVVAQAWSAIGMHDEYWEPVERRLRPGGLVLVNDSTFTTAIRDDVSVHRVSATELASEAGNPLGGSMVMIGAYGALTGLVGVEALVEAMRASIPPYRQQHIESNERVIRLGFDTTERGVHPAWPVVAVGVT